jgi:iron complex outermembrane receptor protein
LSRLCTAGRYGRPAGQWGNNDREQEGVASPIAEACSAAAASARNRRSTVICAGSRARPPEDEEAIIVTGTRAQDRTRLDTPVPIDVFSARDLASTGAVANELGQAIATLAPSVNFPRQSNSGTSDHIRAAQLRGLSPDQVLVLVNGRRRHVSAVVNTETKIGRGTAAVDLNTIPLGAVRRVEILRDGAGAQYGSDAIAGVINIILDDRPSGIDASISTARTSPTMMPWTMMSWTAKR